MFNEIDWREIEVGKQYMYEEKYYLQVEVTVLEDIPTTQENLKRFKIRVDKYCGGLGKVDVGTEFEVAKIVEGDGMYLVSGMKFKPLGSMFDYCATYHDKNKF